MEPHALSAPARTARDGAGQGEALRRRPYRSPLTSTARAARARRVGAFAARMLLFTAAAGAFLFYAPPWTWLGFPVAIGFILIRGGMRRIEPQPRLKGRGLRRTFE